MKKTKNEHSKIFAFAFGNVIIGEAMIAVSGFAFHFNICTKTISPLEAKLQ
jgi:hypothetical protein